MHWIILHQYWSVYVSLSFKIIIVVVDTSLVEYLNYWGRVVQQYLITSDFDFKYSLLISQ